MRQILKGFLCIFICSHTGLAKNFHNFKPHPGLDLIFAGKGFRPHGIPLKTIETLYGLKRTFLGSRVYPNDTDELFMAYGKLSSPPTRKGEDYSVGNSILEVQLCYKKNAVITAALPLDKQLHIDHCSAQKSKLWTHNCLTCHAGAIGEHVIAGAHANYTLQGELADELSTLGEVFKSLGTNIPKDPLEILLTQSLLDLTKYELKLIEQFLDYSERELIPTFKFSKQSGENFGTFTSYKGMGLLNPDKFGFETYKQGEYSSTDEEVFKHQKLAHVDAMPWWNLKFKNSVFWTGETQATQAAPFIYAFTFQHLGSSTNFEFYIDQLQTVLNFAKGLHSPQFPEKINDSLRLKGQEIFHEKPTSIGRSCSSCHGDYQQKTIDNQLHTIVNYNNDSPIDIGTDPDYSRVSSAVTSGIQDLLTDQQQMMQKRYGKVRGDKFAPKLDAASASGVIPPPLVGLWASPPYLHNGSIPTLYDLLKVTTRPDCWQKPLPQKGGFDAKKVGFKYKRLSFCFPKSNSADMRNGGLVQLQEGFGRSNTGHNFAKDWSDRDIYAVIEFLKSVSGEHVLPLHKSKLFTSN